MLGCPYHVLMGCSLNNAWFPLPCTAGLSLKQCLVALTMYWWAVAYTMLGSPYRVLLGCRLNNAWSPSHCPKEKHPIPENMKLKNHNDIYFIITVMLFRFGGIAVWSCLNCDPGVKSGHAAAVTILLWNILENLYTGT